MRLAVWLLAGFAFLTVGQAQAGWNAAFQACCDDRGPSRSSYFAPAPTTSCYKIDYVQRAYYTPVTVYKREVYQEPVTVRYRSYYWEPVTTTSYRSYYDPCTGCSRTVAEPRTSYRLRSQMNCTERYVQRCRMVPVTEQRVSYYMEPVVVPINSNPAPCDSCGNGSSPPAPRSPSLSESPTGAGMSGGNDAPARMPSDRIPATDIPSTNRRPISSPAPAPAPAIRGDRFASRASSQIQGRLMHEDRFTPKAFEKVTLVKKNDPSVRQVVTTDGNGRFQTSVAEGEWSIYTTGRTGQSQYHSSLQTKPNDSRNVMIVSY